MSYEVSSWFLTQLEDRNSNPKRAFYLGSSDYSAWVTKYPKIKRTANDLRSVNVAVELANEDGKFNSFYHYTHTIPNTCTLHIGFTHPDSGDELMTVFTGFLKNVNYSEKSNKRVAKLKMRDRLWDFTERKIGESDAQIDIGSEIPSDIAWTLCTCYGGLDTTQGSNNSDINYIAFLAWAEQFSTDSVLMSAHYEGMKVIEALGRLGKMTDSAIWIEGDGKLAFKKFTEPDSLDQAFSADHYIDLEIDVESLRMVNKHYTFFQYSPESDYWQKTVFATDSLSVSSFGLKEDFIQDETCWYVDSVGALGLSYRKVNIYKNPPRSFEMLSGLYGINRDLGETIRITDSFHGITSGSGWRLTETEYDMQSGMTKFNMDEANVVNAFYLDVSTLDMDDLLL